jgi:hypothetical protein
MPRFGSTGGIGPQHGLAEAVVRFRRARQKSTLMTVLVTSLRVVEKALQSGKARRSGTP